MHKNPSRQWVTPLLVFFIAGLIAPRVAAQQACFTSQERARAEQSAKVYRAPDPGYDPVLGYNPANGPRRGAPQIDEKGLAQPINCVANKDQSPGAGTTPKFHCSVPGNTDEDGNLIRYKIKPHFKGQSPEKRNGEIYGEFLSSRFSKALGFFADDEWVADVTCPDCEKSLTSGFQGADCYRAIHARGARSVIPPQVRARVRGGPEFLDRDAAVLRGREVGRDEWKKEAGYHRRSLAETAMMRLKTIFSDKLKAGEWKRQVTESRVRCAALNRMTALGMPQSYAV